MAENAPRPAGWGPDRAAGINRQQHQSLDTRSSPRPQHRHAQRDLAGRGFRDPVWQLLKKVRRQDSIAFLPGKPDQRWRLNPDRFSRTSVRASEKIGQRPRPLTLRPPRSASPVITAAPSGRRARQRIEWHIGMFTDVVILDSAAE